MKMDTGVPGVQARVVRVWYANTVTRGEIAVRSFPDGPEWITPVTIERCPQQRGVAIVQAVARLLAGAVVMDGADVLAIRDSLDNARGLAGELAPEHASATLAVAAIERTRDRVFDAAFPVQPTAFMETVQ